MKRRKASDLVRVGAFLGRHFALFVFVPTMVHPGEYESTDPN
ncbi:MAG: hypothetical protein ACYDEV_17065 [Acidiferrobacter sp.]